MHAPDIHALVTRIVETHLPAELASHSVGGLPRILRIIRSPDAEHHLAADAEGIADFHFLEGASAALRFVQLVDATVTTLRKWISGKKAPPSASVLAKDWYLRLTGYGMEPKLAKVIVQDFHRDLMRLFQHRA